MRKIAKKNHQLMLCMWLCIVLLSSALAVSVASTRTTEQFDAYSNQQSKETQPTTPIETIPATLDVIPTETKFSPLQTTQSEANLTIQQTTQSEAYLTLPQTTQSEVNSTSQQTTQPITNTTTSEANKSGENSPQNLPEGFVDVTEYISTIRIDLRYFSENNFIGTRIDGYLSGRAILTKEATIALQSAAEALAAQDYGIVFHDGYRPKQAVAHFVRWAEDEVDLKTKAVYYPDLEKSSLIPSGYIAKRSAHSKGSTIDLTLYQLSTRELIDMGCPIDFFGEIAHHDTQLINETQKANRLILKSAMENAGFKPYKN